MYFLLPLMSLMHLCLIKVSISVIKIIWIVETYQFFSACHYSLPKFCMYFIYVLYVCILTWNMIRYCSSGLFTTHMLQPILTLVSWEGSFDSSMLFASWFSDVGVDPCCPITVIPAWDQRLRLCTPWKGFWCSFLCQLPSFRLRLLF